MFYPMGKRVKLSELWWIGACPESFNFAQFLDLTTYDDADDNRRWDMGFRDVELRSIATLCIPVSDRMECGVIDLVSFAGGRYPSKDLPYLRAQVAAYDRDQDAWYWLVGERNFDEAVLRRGPAIARYADFPGVEV